MKGCCAVLGWQDEDQVIVRTERYGILLWRPSTGTVARLRPPAPGLVPVASNGCVQHYTVDGSTFGCLS